MLNSKSENLVPNWTFFQWIAFWSCYHRDSVSLSAKSERLRLADLPLRSPPVHTLWISNIRVPFIGIAMGLPCGMVMQAVGGNVEKRHKHHNPKSFLEPVLNSIFPVCSMMFLINISLGPSIFFHRLPILTVSSCSLPHLLIHHLPVLTVCSCSLPHL